MVGNSKKQVYVYRNYLILWKAAESNLVRISSESSTDKYFVISAVFLYFASFEGYINWLGSRIDKKVWKHERNFFKSEPYIGTLGKYLYLRKILQLPDLDTDKDSYKTIEKCKKIRDMIAHPKIEEGSKPVEALHDELPEPYRSELEKLLLPEDELNETINEKTEKSRDTIRKLIIELHNKARKLYPLEIPEEDAFGLISGYSVTDIT